MWVSRNTIKFTENQVTGVYESGTGVYMYGSEVLGRSICDDQRVPLIPVSNPIIHTNGQGNEVRTHKKSVHSLYQKAPLRGAWVRYRAHPDARSVGVVRTIKSASASCKIRRFTGG